MRSHCSAATLLRRAACTLQRPLRCDLAPKAPTCESSRAAAFSIVLGVAAALSCPPLAPRWAQAHRLDGDAPGCHTRAGPCSPCHVELLFLIGASHVRLQAFLYLEMPDDDPVRMDGRHKQSLAAAARTDCAILLQTTGTEHHGEIFNTDVHGSSIRFALAAATRQNVTHVALKPQAWCSTARPR